MNCLITGANGQLGTELQNLAYTMPEHTFYFHDVNTLDITQYEQINKFFKERKIDVVINCAAYTAVDQAEEEPEKAYLINHTGTKYLAELTYSYGVQLIHISTDYVFDGRHYTPYTPEDEPHPVTVYGTSKRKGEQEVLANKGMIIRTAWLYSPYGKNFVKTIRKLARERNRLNVIFDQIGSPTYAQDLAQTILSIISQYHSHTRSSFTGIYHYSNEGVCSWYDFAYEILNYSGTPCSIQPVRSSEFPTKAERPPYSVLDKNAIKQTFQNAIPYWKSSLYECIKRLAST